MKSRIFYEVDPHNRLILRRTGKRSNIKRFRQVASGRFKTDKKNRLSYEVLKSSATDTPQKIKFSGRYSLDEKHNLVYILDKWNNQYAGSRLRLRTGIIDARSNEIIFLLNSKTSKNKSSVYTMKLHGAWQADKNNRLTFGVKKGDGKSGTITFFNAWKVNKNREIEYIFGPERGSIKLKGSWIIKKRGRLSYILDKRIGSGFNFRTSLGQVIPKREKTYLVFDIIIDISKRKTIKRKIIFSGKWRLTKDRKILLEFSPDRKKIITLKLTKDILDKKGVAYIESFLKDNERYLGGGVVLGW